ncbi:MAG: BPSS1780 family membrane protein [Betaproteobacteria bacterium]
METLPSTAAPPAPRTSREPRRLAAGQGTAFWSEAWRIFQAAPLVWILILLIYVCISIVLVFIPVIGSLAHTVLTPVFAGGTMLGCHALARGEPLEVGHLFAGFKNGRFGPLAVLGLILLAMAIVLGVVCVAVALVTIGMSGLGAMMDAGNANPYATVAGAGVGMFFLLLIGLVGGTVIWMAIWFAPALVTLDGMEPLAAMKASFNGSMANIVPFLIYGLVYIGLAIVASIPFALGWLVLAPMVVGSCYASWRQIFAA